jgi:iron complex transport system substrate-binding protein
MRIVSLLPSATEIVCALGLREQLVGVSHRCDYPPDIEGVAVVTRPSSEHERAGAAGAADVATTRSGAAARARARRVSPDDEFGPGELDMAALLAARPDLVIVRDGGSGPGPRDLEAALIGADFSPAIVSLDPISIEGIFHSITTLGAMTEAEDDAIELVEALREEIGEIEQGVVIRQDAGLRPRRVAILEGLSPLTASGRWMPEQVRRAGGWDVLGREGEPASATSWAAIKEVDPEMLLLSPAGLSLFEAQAVWRKIERPEFWSDIEAVRRGQVFFVEPVYFCRPGPRVVEGVAMLAEIIDPEGFIDTSPPNSWTPLFE